MNKKIVTRTVPSPTGHLHIGTARTALFNYLFANHHQGEMVYRSEDTDKERSSLKFETEIITGLKWLGLNWSGEVMKQSTRNLIYKRYLEQLIEANQAYVSKEISKKDPSQTVEVIRLKNPGSTIKFQDLIRGEVVFDTTELGDFVIARSINDALYHFAVVVDDHEMGVTHILRGEDHISNTPRQILIQTALGFTLPQYAHLPLILASDRSKLSKRHGAVSLTEYKNQGFLPAAIVNYLALLGWSPKTDQEVFTLNELVQNFSLEQINKSGAVFDINKFKWLNQQHLNKLSTAEFFSYTKNALVEANQKFVSINEAMLTRFLPTIRERIHTADEIKTAAKTGEYDFLLNPPEPEPELIKWKNDQSTKAVLPRLEKVIEILKNTNFDSTESVKAALWPYAETVGKGEVLWPVRTALTGKKQSPDPFTCAYTLGKKETLVRLEKAYAKINEQ